MSRKGSRLQLLFLSLITACFHLVQVLSQPNIVILFADNLAYNDVGVFGAATSQTPNIDSLAHDGLKLNNWNSAAHLCSASRAALLTGKYPVRTGVYPGVFRPDAVNGLLPSESTLAEYLKNSEYNYSTSIIGKWHLGHRKSFLPTNQGFDEWIGVPYHMSGGSVDNHTCVYDHDETMWLPLYHNEQIIQQPVKVKELAVRYATAAESFIKRSVVNQRPFFLYLPFSHVHQLCAPRDQPEQSTCQWSSKNGTFIDAVEEMDWIAGEILETLKETGVANDTIVLFTSDNGPWVAEQECSGNKGAFEGRWLIDNVEISCTACPHDYISSPTNDRLRRCIVPGQPELNLDGVHCGQDTGLGSVWEANLRMPALLRWPGHVTARSETMQLVSTLDVVPTMLRIVNIDFNASDIDGIDVSSALLNRDENHLVTQQRPLFFWRDGYKDGPLPAPYGKFDVAAMKFGRYKAFFSTKSAHYNNDEEVYHDPPLLFDVLEDPAEAFPLDPSQHIELLATMTKLAEEHKANIDWEGPLALATDPKYIPCVDRASNCRTDRYNGAIEERLGHVAASVT